MKYALIEDDNRPCTLACVGAPETRCRDQATGLTCTRAKGHDGPHIAHGFMLQRVAYWGEGELPPLVERPEGGHPRRGPARCHEGGSSMSAEPTPPTPVSDGGPAFPETRWSDTHRQEIQWSGMTLRDWFAGQALAGILYVGPYRPTHEIAAEAYKHADNMLREGGHTK